MTWKIKSRRRTRKGEALVLCKDYAVMLPKKHPRLYVTPREVEWSPDPSGSAFVVMRMYETGCYVPNTVVGKDVWQAFCNDMAGHWMAMIRKEANQLCVPCGKAWAGSSLRRYKSLLDRVNRYRLRMIFWLEAAEGTHG